MESYEKYLNQALRYLNLEIQDTDKEIVLRRLNMVNFLAMGINWKSPNQSLRSTQMMSYIIIRELEGMGYLGYLKHPIEIGITGWDTHKWSELIWITEDMEGWRCLDCGAESIEWKDLEMQYCK